MRLILVNFQQHVDVEYVFADNCMTLLKGPSGSGKSTIFRAIYWVMYGKLTEISNWGHDSDKTSVTFEFRYAQSTVILYRQRGPNLFWMKIVPPGTSPDQVKREEGQVAQQKISAMFGSKESWLACCYVEQKEESFLLSTSQSQKIELLNTLSFNEEKPEEIVSQIQEHLVQTQQEVKRVEQILEIYAERIRLAHLVYEQEQANLQIPPGLSLIPPTARDRYLQRLATQKQELDQHRERYVAQQRLEGQRSHLLETEIKLKQSLAALPTKEPKWTVEPSVLEEATKERWLAQQVPVAPIYEVSTGLISTVQLIEHQREINSKLAKKLGYEYDGFKLNHLRQKLTDQLEHQAEREAHQAMLELKSSLLPLENLPSVSADELAEAQRQVEHLARFLPLLDLERKLSQLTGPDVSLDQVQTAHQLVSQLTALLPLWKLAQTRIQRPADLWLTAVQLTEITTRIEYLTRLLPLVEMQAQLASSEVPLVTDEQLERQRAEVSLLEQAIPRADAKERLQLFDAAHPTFMVVTAEDLTRLEKQIEATQLTAQLASPAFEVSQEEFSLYERYAPLIRAEQQLASQTNAGVTWSEVQLAEEYLVMRQLQAQLSAFTLTYATEEEYLALEQQVKMYDEYLRLQELEKLNLSPDLSAQLQAAREHYRHLETSKDVVSCPHCTKPIRILGKEIRAGEGTAPTKGELQAAAQTVKQLEEQEKQSRELEQLTSKLGSLPSGLSKIDKLTKISRLAELKKTRTACRAHDQVQREYQLYLARCGPLPEVPLSVASLREQAQATEAYLATEKQVLALRSSLGEVPATLNRQLSWAEIQAAHQVTLQRATWRARRAELAVEDLQEEIAPLRQRYAQNRALTIQRDQLQAVIDSFGKVEAFGEAFGAIHPREQLKIAKAELTKLVRQHQQGKERRELQQKFDAALSMWPAGEPFESLPVESVKAELLKHKKNYPSLLKRRAQTEEWEQEDLQLSRVDLPEQLPLRLDEAKTQLSLLTKQYDQTQERTSYLATRALYGSLPGDTPEKFLELQRAAQKKLKKLAQDRESSLQREKYQVEYDLLEKQYGWLPIRPIEPLSAKELLDAKRILAEISQIAFVDAPNHSAEELLRSKQYQEAQSLLQTVSSEVQAFLATCQSWDQIEVLRKMVQQAMADYASQVQQRTFFSTQLEETQRQLAEIVIDDSLGDLVVTVSQQIEELEQRLEYSRQMDQVNRYREETEKLEELLETEKAKYEQLTGHLTKVRRLRVLAQEIQCQMLDTTTDTINLELANVTTNLFEDPISVRLELEKELKTNKTVKQEINLQISYKGAVPKSIKSISGGEQDRISLAITLALTKMNTFPVLILDETFASLPTENREACLKTLRKAIGGSKTIIISGHEFIEGFFDEVVTV